jgi:hypothetical protein
MEAQMVAKANYYKKVSKRVYPGAVSMAQAHKTIFKVCLLGAVLGMIGPLVGRYQDHNGFAFFIGPVLGPVAAALILAVFPFRPYRGAPFAPDGFRRLKADNPEDAVLVSIFRSDEIKRFLWISALKLTLILEPIMAALSLLYRHSLNWTLPGPVTAVIGPVVASYLALATRVMDHGFKAYAVAEDSSKIE